MNIPKYSLENRKVVFFFLTILLLGGILSFGRLPKKEDSPFIIKTAVLITSYPGATAEEVQELITEPIEREIQSMSEVKEIKSESYYGMSKITIELAPTINPERMPTKWDELRRKVSNVQAHLPMGASAISVNDDFGDVFGIYYALVADKGFTPKELRNWAQRIKIEITPIDGVQKVSLFGEQQQVINISLPMTKASHLGINPITIQQTLQMQNIFVNTGEFATGAYQLRINADGTYKSIDDIREQIIVSSSGIKVRLGDIANVEQGYLEPPRSIMHVDGKEAIGIGVATGTEDDVVAVGEVVAAKIADLQNILPVGLRITSIYPEDIIAKDANNGFISNLIISLLIVIVVIFIVMGKRAGMLIGSSLLFAVGGTLLIMLFMNVGLNRTSLAAFIIAMGMLVDNAIVVTDNAQISIKRGVKRYQALIDAALKPQWALLGATFIAICSFLPLFLAPEAVAEIVKPLFIVLAVSLGLSWILALTQTTTFGSFILKENDGTGGADPYDTKFYHRFEKFLTTLIKRRFVTLISVVITLFISLWVMSIMPQTFFPQMKKAYFRADLIFPEGTSIREVEQNIKKIEEYITNNDRIKTSSITMGSSPIRYYLASSSLGPKSNFANVLIETKEYDDTAIEEERFYEYMRNNYPEILTRSGLFALSPVSEAAIEIGFIGPNVDTLQSLVEKAKVIANQSELVMEVRDNWGEKIPVWNPLYSQEKGLRLGITRQQFANAIQTATNGIAIGEYRERDVFMPILFKMEEINSMDINQIKSLPIYSATGQSVELEQVAESFELEYRHSMVRRYNRQPCMLMQCEPQRGGNTIAAFQDVYGKIKKDIKVPEGYKLVYFGERRSQEDGTNSIMENVPLMLILCYIALLLLFPKNYRKPVLIMLMLPLMFIGIVLGLITFGKSFDFFAILGLLGLIGMNIKNAIVLVDEIGLQLSEGLTPLKAVTEATKTRIVPVVMASGTTILGMLPLLADAMFAGMAATIMGGLLFSTILTILVLPVTYCIFFKIKSE